MRVQKEKKFTIRKESKKKKIKRYDRLKDGNIQV